MIQALGGGTSNLEHAISTQIIVPDLKVIPHLSHILSTINQSGQSDILHMSNLVKQTKPIKEHSFGHTHPKLGNKAIQVHQEKMLQSKMQKKECVIKITDWEKLEWAGVGFPLEDRWILHNQMIKLASQYQAVQIRFWGKILGLHNDYYVMQAVTPSNNLLFVPPPSAQPPSVGINFFTYLVTTSLHPAHWEQLPFITPNHIKVSRQIKRLFTGSLNAQVGGWPKFEGEERHYLKAQIVRITSALEIVPKGVYKLNDQNPKIIEYEEEVKIPEFAELSTLESWQHRNANILSLGRTTHYIDPSLPEDQIEAYTAQLTQKDPEIERLRLITQDKLPQGNIYNTENLWSVRVAGDNQIFTKQQGNLVYGVAVLKNLYWPGWATVGFRNGFSSLYVGTGHKSTQPVWNLYENPAIMEDAEDKGQFPEPNPKELPKPPEEPANQEGEAPPQEQ